MSRLLLAGLSLVLLSACGTTPAKPRASAEPTVSAGPRVSAVPPVSAKPPVSTGPPGRTVADYFSPPQAYPGLTWTRHGRPVDGGELSSSAGPEHCGWQSVVFLFVGWPLGTVSQTSAEVREFVRDPNGVFDQRLRPLVRHAVLPADAADTGYRTGGLELWLSPSNPDAAYLRSGSDVERWPRADPLIACA